METTWSIKPSKWRKKAGGGKTPYQGLFIPGNKDKYVGDVNNIIFRSGLELRLFKYLDNHPQIIHWNSEECVIRYLSPKDNKIHRYFLDAQITTKTDKGEQTYLIEVKPSYQCVAPKPPKKPNKRNEFRYLKESRIWLVNSAKWAAAERYCAERNWKFVKLTEKELTY